MIGLQNVSQHLIFLKNPNPNSPNPKTLINCSSSIQAPTPADSGLRFRDKLLYLQTLNVNPAKALQKNPNFRSTSIESLKSVENCLHSMGIERSAFGRILDMHPTLLSSDPYADLYPVFDFLLNDVSIPFPDIRKSIIRCPRLLVCSVEDQLRPALCFLRELGFVGANAITCQNTLLLVSSVEWTLLPKLDYLKSLGFGYGEVENMVLRSPALLTYSVENNLKPKVEYFLDVMNGDLAELRRFPQFFSFSLEGRIRRRHQILVKHGFSMGLAEMLKVSDGEFNARMIEMIMRVAAEA